MKTVAELKAERAALHARAKGIQALADTEGRSLKADEEKSISESLSQFQALTLDITRREALDVNESALTGNVGVGFVAPAGYQASRPGSGGFKDLPDFFRALAGKARGVMDARLVAAAGDYQNMTTSGDGGVAVPTDFRKEIAQLLVGQDDLLSLATSLPIDGRTISTPVDQSAPWADDGLAFDDLVEGQAMVEDKGSLVAWTATLAKHGKLVYCSSELLKSGQGIESWLTSNIRERFTALRNKKFLAAVKGSASKVSVTRGVGQATTGAPTLANLQAMLVGIAEAFVGDAIWVTSRAMIPALQNLNLSANGVPVFIPGGSIANKPHDTLFGLPIRYTEASDAAIGAADDIVLVNPRTIVNVFCGTDMPRFDVSAHAAFARDLIAYRWLVEFAVKSRPQVTWTRLDGTVCSNIVGLTAHS